MSLVLVVLVLRVILNLLIGGICVFYFRYSCLIIGSCLKVCFEVFKKVLISFYDVKMIIKYR